MTKEKDLFEPSEIEKWVEVGIKTERERIKEIIFQIKQQISYVVDETTFLKICARINRIEQQISDNHSLQETKLGNSFVTSQEDNGLRDKTPANTRKGKSEGTK